MMQIISFPHSLLWRVKTKSDKWTKERIMAIAYLIDAAKKTVSQVEYNNVEDINRLIGCQTFCLGFADHVTGDTLYVDDEGLLHHPQHFFLFAKRRDQPLAGNGLMVGREVEGDEYPNGYTTLPPKMTLVALRKQIVFSIT